MQTHLRPLAILHNLRGRRLILCSRSTANSALVRGKSSLLHTGRFRIVGSAITCHIIAAPHNCPATYRNIFVFRCSRISVVNRHGYVCGCIPVFIHRVVRRACRSAEQRHQRNEYQEVRQNLLHVASFHVGRKENVAFVMPPNPPLVRGTTAMVQMASC